MLIKTANFELAVYQKGSADAAKLALVLPGRLDTKDYVHMTDMVDFLASQGYLAVSFDPSGTWESPGQINLYTATNYIQAVHEIIAHFDNKPTLIFGHSRGGNIGMLATVDNPAVWGFVAAFSSRGPSSIELPASPGQSVKSGRDLPPGTERTQQQKMFALPYEYYVDQQQYDVTPLLATCTKPKLFLYGTQDNLVTEKYVRAGFEQAAEPKLLAAVDTEHDYRLHPSAMQAVREQVKNFLETYDKC